MTTATKQAWMGSQLRLHSLLDIRGRVLFRIIGLAVTLVVLFYTVQNIYDPGELPSFSHFSNFSIPDSLKPQAWRFPQAAPSRNHSSTPAFNSTDAEVDGPALNDTSTEHAVSEEITDPSNIWTATPPKSDIGKVTIVFGGENPTYERAIRTHEVHNRRFGYPLHILRHGILNNVWTKPAYILSLLLKELSKPEHERLKWLLWFDADTVIMNPNIPISIFLPPAHLDATLFSHVHILVTNDMNGLNNGVFPIRVHPWSVELMSAVVAFTTYRPDFHLTFRDQSALDEMLKEARFRDNVVYLPQRWFNAYQGELNETLGPFQMRRGDFLVHFAGVPNRDERMRLWMERAEHHLPEWEIDLIHSSYPTETHDFWEERRREIEIKEIALQDSVDAAEKLMQSTESLLREFATSMPYADREQIPSRIANLRKILAEQRESKSAVDKAAEELRSATNPLRSLEEASRKATVKTAHMAIFDAESIMVNVVSEGGPGSHSDKAKTIEELVEKLKEMIVRRPEDREGVNREAAKLVEVTKQLETEIQREEDEKASKAKTAIELEKQQHQPQSDSHYGESLADKTEEAAGTTQVEVEGLDKKERRENEGTHGHDSGGA